MALLRKALFVKVSWWREERGHFPVTTAELVTMSSSAIQLATADYSCALLPLLPSYELRNGPLDNPTRGNAWRTFLLKLPASGSTLILFGCPAPSR